LRVYAIGVLQDTTPAGLSLALSRLECPLDPALKSEACARKYRYDSDSAGGGLFLFSAGLFTVNPDEGVNTPTEAFVATASFANPLVVWPAVEFYLPAIPLSVGTAVVMSHVTRPVLERFLDDLDAVAPAEGGG